MEIDKANILMYLGMLGALACLPAIFMTILGHTVPWGHEVVPGSNDVTFVYFYDVNTLFITEVSLLVGSCLLAAGLVGFLVIHRNPMSIIGSSALVISAYFTWVWFEEASRLATLGRWITGAEWTSFMAMFQWGISLFLVAFALLGITVMVTKESRIAGVVAFVVSLVSYILQYLIEGLGWPHLSLALMVVAFFSALLAFAGGRKELDRSTGGE